MSDFEEGFIDELRKIAEKDWEEEKKFIRRSGPAIGALIGSGVGAVHGAKKGRVALELLAGLGTGATLGWMPDVAMTTSEAVRRYRKKGVIPQTIQEVVKP